MACGPALRERLRAATAEADLKGFSERFLLSEWTNVVDAWSLKSLDAYSTVSAHLIPWCRDRIEHAKLPPI
jgi:hypothetical protein